MNLFDGNKNVDNYETEYFINKLHMKYCKMKENKRVEIDICEDGLGKKRRNVVDHGNNCEPWTSRECIFILDHILKRNEIGLEWSSGSSTLWLSYRLKSLLSIENNKEWSEEVNNKIIKLNITNAKVINISPKNGECEKKYIGNDKMCYKDYVNINLDNYKNKFDFINIDGRARAECLLRAIKLIKPYNGIIMLDNSERERYFYAYKKIPKSWKRFDFTYHVNRKDRVTLWISN